MTMLLHRARLLDLRTGRPGDPCDILLSGGRIDSIRPSLPRPSTVQAPVIDLDGRLVIPGLWDEHVHTEQWALASRRVEVSQTASPAEILRTIADHLATLTGPADGEIIQGFGLRASRWPANPSAADLDAVSGRWPVAIVSADLHSTWCNTAALQRLGIPDRPGFLTEADSFAAQIKLAQVPTRSLDMWLDECCRRVAARGVVGIGDMEFSSDVDVWLAREQAGRCPMRVQVAVYPDRLDEAIGRGLATGQCAAEEPGSGPESLVAMGPLKIISDGSVSTRSAWCRQPYPGASGPEGSGVDAVPLAELESLIARATRAGIQPAVHAIGDLAVSTVLDAYQHCGVGGRLEHAQLVEDADLPRFAALGVTVSIQPAHLIDDRDVMDQVWGDLNVGSFRFRDMLDAGARLIMGSDAPVSPVDPWLAIRVAVERTGDQRPGWYPGQEITVSEALRASTHGVEAVAPGGRADLVALEDDPFGSHGEELASISSALTVVGGQVSHTTL